MSEIKGIYAASLSILDSNLALNVKKTIILNQNLFDVTRYDVHKTKPVAVIMDGKLVHGWLDL